MRVSSCLASSPVIAELPPSTHSYSPPAPARQPDARFLSLSTLRSKSMSVMAPV